MKLADKIAVIFSITALVLQGCSSPNSKDLSIITGEKDLVAGCRIGVMTGSVQDLYVTDNHPECEVVRGESFPDIYILLEQGKVDALFGSTLVWAVEKYDFPKVVCVDSVAPAPVAFAFSKGQGELKREFNSFLALLKESGELDRISSLWLKRDSDRQIQEYPDDTCPLGELVVAVNATMVPYCYIKDSKIQGIEVEILSLFAHEMGYRLKIVDMAFSAVIPYLVSGKAQMAAAEMCVTEERSQSVDFSDPWIQEYESILVLRERSPYADGSSSEGDDESLFKAIADSFYKNIIYDDRYMLLLKGLGNTILISILAAIFGTLMGVLLCWGSVSRSKFVAKSTDLFIEFMRKMPQVVFLMIMFYIVFGSVDINGTIVATIAFSLCFGAYTSVIFRSSLESIDKGQGEAALSMGFTRMGTFLNVILPQVVQRALPVYKGEFIGLVKATSIVGYIAVFDLTKAGDVIRSRTYEAFFPLIMVTIIYFVIIWLLSLALKALEIKTRPVRKKFSR